MAGSDDLLGVFDFAEGNDPIDPRLIDLFNLTRGDATTEELAGEQSIVAAMITAMTPATTAVPSNVIPFSRSSVRQRFTTTKTATKAAIITGVVLFSATAAAAGGVLPHAAQSAISRAVEHVGIHVDNPDKQAEDATSTSTTIKTVTGSSVDAHDSSKTGAVGPDATATAKDGLCQSFFEHQNNPAKAEDSVAAKNLADAAAKAGQTITAFCATATSTPTSIDDHGGGTNTSVNGSHGADDTNTSSTLAGNPTSGKGGTHSGTDDTSTTTPTITVPGQADPTITTTSIDNHGGGNSGGGNSNGGNPKP